MLKLRVREYTPAGVRGRVLPADEIIHTDNENGTATLSFSLSTKMAGRLDTPFVVGVEYAVDKGLYQPVSRNDLFIMDEDSGDDADSAKTVKFSGEAACLWLMQRNHAWWNERTKDNVREFHSGGNPVSAGFVMRELIDSSIAYGWAPQFKTDFSGTVDSAGQAWHADEKTKFPVNVPSPLSKVVGSLAEQGLAEFATAGFTLRMYRPGTTRDRTNVVLGGPRFERIPVKVSAKQMYSVLAVLPDGLPDFTLPVPGADTRFGKLDGLITQSGVSDLATAHRLAQPQVALGNRASREEGYEWTPAGNDFVPWRDFQVGDTVSARSRGGKLSRRVIGLVTRMQAGGATVRAIVGERVGSDSIRFAKKLSTVGVGGVAGGTGAAFPASAGVPSAAPDRPAGLVEVSNSGSWGDDGTAHSAVGLSWAAVTATTLGTEADVAHYEVWSRLPSGELAFDTQVTGTSATITSWEPGRLRLVVVYAISTRGVRSEASLELPVTPVMPASLVPRAPVGLAIDSNVGVFTESGPVASVVLSFTAVTLSVDGELVEVSEYEVWDADGPLSRFPASPVVVQIPSGADRDLRVRAMSVHGVWGDLSSVLNVTGALPSVVSRAPSDPVMSTSMGNAFAMWDGGYSTGGAGAHTVRVEARVGTTGDFIQQAVLTGPTNQLIRLGGKGDMVQVRFRAYDQLGRLTGTSAVKSIVVEGVAFESFDDVARDRIIGTEDALAAVEAGQVVIGRTVDGLNRTFTSVESPGRGYLGHFNLAPAIKGSGTWAEVRRNYANDPLALGVNNTGNAVNVTDFPDEVNTAWEHVKSGSTAIRMIDVIVGENAPVGVDVRFRCLIWLSEPRNLEIGLRDSIASIMRSTNRSFPAGLSEVDIEWSGAWNAPTSTAGITLIARSGWGTGDVFRATKFIIEEGHEDRPFFAAGFPSPDPDMRTRWLGTPNASESVMEIERVAGMTATRCIAGVSSRNGIPAVRGIPIDPTNGDSYIWMTVPTVARNGGVFIATSHLDESIAGIQPGGIMTALPDRRKTRPAHTPGAIALRHEYDALESLYIYRLTVGTLRGGVEPAWSNIGLYAGTLPDTAVPFHNGDLWHRLDYKNGELTVVEILVWDGQDWAPYGLWLDSLAVAGSVSADLLNATQIWADEAWLNVLRAGVIEVDMVTPNFGENLNLYANGAIVLMAGRQDNADTAIAEAQTAADQAASDAADAGNAAGAAAAAAAVADGKALVAQTMAQSTQAALTSHQAVFVVTPTGAEVRTQDGSNILHLSPDGVQIIQGGTPASTWDAGRLIVHEAILNRAQIGAHIIEKYATGRTIIRPI